MREAVGRADGAREKLKPKKSQTENAKEEETGNLHM